MIRFSDVKYTYRGMVKKFRFTMLTISVMAVGLSLSVYLFSFLNVQVFQDMPFEDGDSLVQIYASKNGARESGTLSLHDFSEIRKNVHSLEEFGVYRNVNINVSGIDGARRYSAVATEPNIFQLTRIAPLHGRSFTLAENQVGAESVVVVGYDLWKNYLGGDANAIGSYLRVNGAPHKVIGIMPKDFYFPVNAELWLPIQEDANRIPRGEAGEVYGLAHIKNGFTIEDVNAEIGLIMQRLESTYPKTNTGVGAYAEFIPRSIAGDGIVIGYSMQFIALMLLLLAAVNVGNLLLARTIERGKETAVRIALGAPRARLVGQILLESIIVCFIGAGIGLILLSWGLELTEQITSSYSVDRPPFWWKFGLDAYTLKLAALFVVITVIVTGLFPIWKSATMDFNAVLRDGTRGSQGKRDGRLNRVLIVGEIFVSLTVLIAAGVMAFVNVKAFRADYGAETEGVLTAEILLPERGYLTAQDKTNFIRRLETLLANSNGIDSVVFSTALPGQYADLEPIAIDGFEYDSDAGYPETNYVVSTASSLKKLGVTLKNGRYFNSGDQNKNNTTVIVTESFVQKYFPDENIIGRRLRIVDNKETIEWLTIVGVVAHTIQGSYLSSEGALPTVFRPYSQDPSDTIIVGIKSELPQADAVTVLRRSVSSIAPDLPAFNIETYKDKIGRHLRPLEFITGVFMLFGLAGAVLAGSGIYGVLSNSIVQKTQEIGVKRAFGASDNRIYGEFFRQGIKQFLIGGVPAVILGSLMAFGMAQVFPVGLGDIIFIASALIILVFFVVMIATYVPARRALNMEPVDAIRYE
ncbi:ABC transporter permease [Teredinibacter turnerae]|uniref:ABC transporter permease n=1 Tax=Teredinibacter turnerae TaxID=2426 RepID=UPI0005F7DD9B|nr:ABC transporter permease [Teredinibacter turnerae]